jgi:hypothetical protein
MAKDHKANSAGGCGCSSKAASPETPTTKSGCCGDAGSGHSHDHDHHHHHAASKAGAVDPVCGMTVDPETCACRKSNPNILVVQPAQDRAAKNGPGQFDGARDRLYLSEIKLAHTDGEVRRGMASAQCGQRHE